MTAKRAAQILWLHKVLPICAGVCLALSLLFHFCLGGVTQKEYDHYLSVSAAADQQTRVDAYSNAILLSPENGKAYLELLTLYGEDGLFEKEESDTFLALYNAGLADDPAKADEAYAIHEKAGLLYINSYNAPYATRLRFALPFLETAYSLLPEGESACLLRCYHRIATYYRDYIWDTTAMREATPEQMSQLLTEISETLQALRADTTVDTLYPQLGFCRAACELLCEQGQTLALTVPQEDVLALMEWIYADLPSPESIQKTKTRTLLKLLLDNQSLYIKTIQEIYS